jgi:hypothetical protein
MLRLLRENFPVTGAAERFWAKVDIGGPDECWPWTAGTYRKGYGQFNAGPPWHPNHAHRYAWIYTYGDPGELHVLHSCDNPPCCNPAHLFLGTNADNMADKVAKGRQRTRTLTAEQVAEIDRLDASGLSRTEIAKRLNLHPSTVSRRLTGTWRRGDRHH